MTVPGRSKPRYRPSENRISFAEWLEKLNLDPNYKIYEILPDESPDMFERFVYFRNLGPTRTIPISQKAFHESKGFTYDVKNLSGAVYAHAREWFWRERASLYDIDKLEQCGPDTVMALNMLIKRITHIALDALDRIKVENVEDICKILDRLPNFVPRTARDEPYYDRLAIEKIIRENPALLSNDTGFNSAVQQDRDGERDREDGEGTD